MGWINWRDLAQHFYKLPKDIAHMEEMLEYLKLPKAGPSKKSISQMIQRTRMKRFHDIISICRIVRKLMADGAILEWTGKRKNEKIIYRLKRQVSDYSRKGKSPKKSFQRSGRERRRNTV